MVQKRFFNMARPSFRTFGRDAGASVREDHTLGVAWASNGGYGRFEMEASGDEEEVLHADVGVAERDRLVVRREWWLKALSCFVGDVPSGS